MSNDMIIYNTEDGKSKISLKLENGTVWLSQLEIAELFETTKQNVSKHIKAIFEDGELLKMKEQERLDVKLPTIILI